MPKKQKRRSGELTSSQHRYLYRQFLALYLHSESVRKEFDRAINQESDLAEILGVVEREEQSILPQEFHDRLLEAKPKPKRDYGAIFKNKTLRKRTLVLAVVSLLVVAAQLAYPHDRSLPLARLQANGFVGFTTRQQVLSKYADFEGRTVTVHTHNKNLTTSYSDLGVTLTPDSTVDSLSRYPIKQRLIPFSFLFAGNKTFAMDRHLDDTQLGLFARDIVAEVNEPSHDASAKLEGTKITVTPAKEGYEYQLSYLRSQVLKSDLSNGEQIVFKPTILAPAIATEIVSYNAGRMQDRINNPLTIHADGHTQTVDSATLASWVEILPKPESKTIEFSFNKSRVAATLRGFPGQVDLPARPTVITMLNGSQAGMNQGENGKSLQFNDLVDRVSVTSTAATQTVEATVDPVIPSVVYERHYTKDNVGIQSLFTYWTGNHSGKYSIDFRTVNGLVEANLNSYQTYPAVGIYQIYIAHSVYGRIAARSISGSTQTSAGQSVDVCLDKMLRLSDGNCTNALGDLVGWGAADEQLRAQGFNDTTLAQGASLTTANDTSDWMVKILGGNVISRSQIDSITSTMKRQANRSGIPAGSPGMAVADKTGSYGRIKHDVGIVYHPKGIYVLSVLSEGSTFANIADLTSEINKVMDQ